MTRVSLIVLMAMAIGVTAAPTPTHADHPCGEEGSGPDVGFNPGQGGSEIGVHACLEAGEQPDDTPPAPPSRYRVITEREPPCWRVETVPVSSDLYDDAFTSTDAAHEFGETLYGTLLPVINAFLEALDEASGGVLDIDFAFPDMVLECESVAPEVQAYLAWRDQVVLPPPAGELDPGDEVVTGMDTYLRIGDYAPDWDADSDPRTVSWSGPITIVATAEHRIDWGDGTVTPENGWYATNGRAWSDDSPDDAPEPIIHVYQDATEGDALYTLTVTTRWTARWSTADGSASGVVPFFRYSESTVDLDVDEVQPVVIDQS